jgi:hypothetical protein
LLPIRGFAPACATAKRASWRTADECEHASVWIKADRLHPLEVRLHADLTILANPPPRSVEREPFPLAA